MLKVTGFLIPGPERERVRKRSSIIEVSKPPSQFKDVVFFIKERDPVSREANKSSNWGSDVEQANSFFLNQLQSQWSVLNKK